MINKKNIRNFANEIDPKKLCEKVETSIFSSMNQLTIIRSASIELFTSAVNKIIERNPNIEINVITHQKDIETIKENFPQLDLLIYNGDGPFEKRKLYELLQRKKHPNLLIIYNNVWGSGYSNIENSIANLNREFQAYFYNINKEFYKINNIQLKLINERLLFYIFQWYEDYLSIRGF